MLLYRQLAGAAVGKDRIDWQVDPPPNLVIEIDVTTYTNAEDYAPYSVPEVWLFKNSGLKVYELQGDTYQEQSRSRYFPTVDLSALIAQVLEVAAERGTGVALRELLEPIPNEFFST